jgi:mannan endo-1,4-beta-mannosidase
MGMKRHLGFSVLFVVVALSETAQADHAPVDPKAIPEAKALLEYIYSISGKQILSGQHNYPNVRDRNSQFAAQYIGKTPVVFSTDWGFADEHSTDSYLGRPDIVEEAIRQHHQGAIVTICWHAVPPTADEPVTFRAMPGSDPKALASVQGKILDEQFRDVLTPGTKLHARWAAQVDEIAKFLKQLQDAKVPVLWRPYHEMNGDWFWWGGRIGKYSTIDLYKQLYERLVNHHHLHNLLWVWSIDRPHSEAMDYAMDYAKFFPGIEYLDILSLDVYGNDFSQPYYDKLVALSHGKPLALGEVGNPPSAEILDVQPKWTYYVTWAGLVRNTSKEQYKALVQNGRVLGLTDAAYIKSAAQYWKACGITPNSTPVPPPNFSGLWVLSEKQSTLDRRGRGFLSARLEVKNSGNEFTVLRTRDTEWGDSNTTKEVLTLDGAEHKSTRFNAPLVTTATRSSDGTIEVNSTTSFGENNLKSREKWRLDDDGQTLVIEQKAQTPWGDRNDKLVYRRWQ